VAAPAATLSRRRVRPAALAAGEVADPVVRDQRSLPDPDRVRKMVRVGHDPLSKPPTVAQWLEAR
jgi:hypothetical protein